ncbi:MAG: YceD family protein [Saezia sp.]
MTNRLPPILDIEKFAREHGELSGELCLKDMPRLMKACVYPLPDGITPETPLVRWHAQGAMKEDVLRRARPWLLLELEGQLPVRCERCLQGVIERVVEHFDYRFVATEAQAIQEDSESEEVVLVASQEFDLLELCEDELIMSIPFMPLHEQCVSPLVEGLDKAGIALQVADEDAPGDEKINPFAILEQLKKKPH